MTKLGGRRSWGRLQHKPIFRILTWALGLKRGRPGAGAVHSQLVLVSMWFRVECLHSGSSRWFIDAIISVLINTIALGAYSGSYWPDHFCPRVEFALTEWLSSFTGWSVRYSVIPWESKVTPEERFRTVLSSVFPAKVKERDRQTDRLQMKRCQKIPWIWFPCEQSEGSVLLRKSILERLVS